ncbi:MAG: acyl-CoA reductase [Opitutaceae bacterium]|nr:acyl-CoA reductase [Cytophagales bacterium]
MSTALKHITLNNRIACFVALGKFISSMSMEEMESLSRKAKYENAWFTEDSLKTALTSLADMLKEDSLINFIPFYPELNKEVQSKNIGVIMAGNIPGVGFHDAFCVLLSGHILQAKLSKSDTIIMKFLLEKIVEIAPDFKLFIQVVERMANMEAVICTGSDNSARYFESYFGKYPHIIRKNRTSVAILNGKESVSDFEKLGSDIFTYFGLGCRNVTKVYIPENYDITKLIDTFEPWSFVINQHKYANNYTYNRAIYLMNQDPFLDNNFLLLKESESLHSPISVLYYERYSDQNKLTAELTEKADKLQCVVTNTDFKNKISFGQTQNPGLNDFADGVDTMKFLLQL